MVSMQNASHTQALTELAQVNFLLAYSPYLTAPTSCIRVSSPRHLKQALEFRCIDDKDRVAMPQEVVPVEVHVICDFGVGNSQYKPSFHIELLGGYQLLVNVIARRLSLHLEIRGQECCFQRKKDHHFHVKR